MSVFYRCESCGKTGRSHETLDWLIGGPRNQSWVTWHCCSYACLAAFAARESGMDAQDLVELALDLGELFPELESSA